MIRFVFIAVYFIFANSSSYTLGAEENYLSHMILKNYAEALPLIDIELKKNPQEQLLRKQLLTEEKIICLAHLGREAETMELLQIQGAESLSNRLIEEIAWSIIERAAASTAPQIRFEALLAGFFTQDVRACSMIKEALHDPDTTVRSFAFYVASQFRDTSFYEDALYAIDNDTSIQARCASIEFLGTSHKKEAHDLLMELLQSRAKSTEEKVCAMNALCQNLQAKDIELVTTLLDSDSWALRALGWKIVSEHQELAPSLGYFEKQESHEEVLLQKILATARTPHRPDHFAFLMQSSNFRVKALASWYFLIKGSASQSQEAANVLDALLQAPKEVALITAALLSHSGDKGLFILKKYFSSHSDPHVRITLAQGLVRERVEVEKAAATIRSSLQGISQLIDTQEFLLFDYIAPSHQSRIAWLPCYPETKDLLTRLKVYALLATCDESACDEDLAVFLKKKAWGVVFEASSCLLEEWPMQAKDHLSRLLSSNDKEVQLQAAIVLAFTYQDETAEAILYESYPQASRQLKEEILLAIAMIGSKKSIPFLIQVLHESSQKLRCRAAAALLQCINR